MDVVVGLDCGTTSTKAVAAGPDGRVRAVGRAGHALHVPAPGHAELDGHALRAAVAAALADLAAQLERTGDRPQAVVLCSAMHGLVPLDAEGRPVGPLLTWGDTRATAAAERLRAGPGPGLHARTGTPVHPMSPLVKLVHLRGTLRPPRWGGVKEVLVALLCGPVRQVDDSAAGSSGLYDPVARRWDPEALDLAGVDAAQLDEVVPTTHLLGPLRPGLGLPAGLPVVAGATDGPLATLGSGATAPGTLAVSLGTSGALRVAVERFRPDPRLFCYPLAPGRWVLGGATNGAGSLLAWLSGITGQPPEVLLEEARAVPAGSDGLVLRPHLLGERAPWWRAGLTGALLGLRQDHGRGHLARAAVEGACQQLALVRAALPGPAHEVRATGGGTASPLWREVLAAALDLPVRVPATAEGTGLGACLLGWHVLGELPDLDAAAARVPVGPVLAPDPRLRDVLAAARPAAERASLGLLQVLPGRAEEQA